MRALVSLVLFLFGAALAFGYPLMVKRMPSTAIGAYPIYAPATGFTRVEAKLRPDDAPVQVYVDLMSTGSPKFDAARAVLSLTASASGKTVLAEPVTFADATVRDDTPQTPELIYRAKVGTIDTVDASAPTYTFVAGQGDAEGIDLGQAQLVLERGPQEADPRAQPVGFAVMAIGAVAFLLSLRGRGERPPPNPNSKPPPPRWGREASERR